MSEAADAASREEDIGKRFKMHTYVGETAYTNTNYCSTCPLVQRHGFENENEAMKHSNTKTSRPPQAKAKGTLARFDLTRSRGWVEFY